MLTIADVDKQFAGHRVLASVSLSLEAGEIVALRGPNGTGKSTLCDIIAGVLDADRGSVIIDGASIRTSRARAAIGYAPSSALLPDTLFVHEWMDLVASLRNASHREVDDMVAVWSLETCTDARLSSLSLGQRRRLALACAELGHPRLLLLDEPTVGLDDNGRATLVRRLQIHLKNGGSALVATHDDAPFGCLATRPFTLRPPSPSGRGLG